MPALSRFRSLAALAALLGGCAADPVSPVREIAGTFRPVTLDGRAVPFVGGAGMGRSGSCTTIIEGGDLEFTRKGRFALTRVAEREFCDGRLFRTTVGIPQVGVYRVVGPIIEFQLDDGGAFTGEFTPAPDPRGARRVLAVRLRLDGHDYEYVASDR